MRETLFGGTRKDNGSWVEGDLIQLHDGRKFIVNNKFGACLDNKGNFINTEAPAVDQVRERLIEILREPVPVINGYNEIGVSQMDIVDAEKAADRLLENGVIVTPCVAMVEQFIKDGKFDEKLTAHNGRYAVVYIDKSKWNCPLIDITEQRYKAEKAEERIQALKGGASDGNL